MINYGYGICLDSLDEQHLEWARKNRNEKEINKWCRQSSLISSSDQIRWYESQSLDPKIKMFSIWVDFEGSGLDMVGVCGFTDIDRLNQRAEFSLWISTDKQRKGYSKAALKTLFSHGFNDLNFNVIWGETFEGNPALKIFNGLGMVTEGKRRQFYFKDGNFIDAYLVSLTREEWKCQTYFQSSLEAYSYLDY